MIYRFTTEKGVDMTARLVLRGRPYGNAGCLSAETPMVEFFKVVNDTKHNPWLTDVYNLKHDLYFISRYNLDTFLFGYCGPGPIEVGLCLEGSAPEYNLGPQECRAIAANLFSQLAREKFE